jgi:hypothetical protein
LNGRNIPFVNNVKYLGVIFDKRMTWRLHIEKIEAKAFRTFIRFVGAFHGNLPQVTQTGIQETTQ